MFGPDALALTGDAFDRACEVSAQAGEPTFNKSSLPASSPKKRRTSSAGAVRLRLGGSWPAATTLEELNLPRRIPSPQARAVVRTPCAWFGVVRVRRGATGRVRGQPWRAAQRINPTIRRGRKRYRHSACRLFIGRRAHRAQLSHMREPMRASTFAAYPAIAPESSNSKNQPAADIANMRPTIRSDCGRSEEV
jgi:hypothetical protein